jgi:hypothetical protein
MLKNSFLFLKEQQNGKIRPVPVPVPVPKPQVKGVEHVLRKFFQKSVEEWSFFLQITTYKLITHTKSRYFPLNYATAFIYWFLRT